MFSLTGATKYKYIPNYKDMHLLRLSVMSIMNASCLYNGLMAT